MEHKTLIIFDWDDTLFPTSWIVQNNINLTDKNIQNKYIILFTRLDTLLHQLLTTAMKHGKVIIVTNAVKKWIEISLNMLPNTKKLIQSNIEIISARDIYQEKYPDQLSLWKKLVFYNYVLNHFKAHPLQNIISIGDAEHEFNALVDLYNAHSVVKKRILKTVRLIKDPNFETLLDQLNVLKNNFVHIIRNKKHMDLVFQTPISQ